MYWIAADWFPAMPFSRFCSRALLVAAVLSFGPVLWRQWRLSQAEAEAAGEAKSGGWKGPALALAAGFLFGIASLVLLCAGHIWTGERVWSGGLLVRTTLSALATGWAVSVAEELVFRGGLQLLMMRVCGNVAGVILTAFIFATAHFLKPEGFAPDGLSVPWHAGFQALGWAFAPVLDPETYGTAYIAYLLVGLILGGVAWGTGNLWAAIGLHAGWVFALKVGSIVTQPPTGPHTAMGDLLTGAPSIVVLGGTCVAVIMWLWTKQMFVGKQFAEGVRQ
ncbi:hypothetical protein DB346_17750 [Verrucomicrobia bacterium LW23]|nr:hypothetical protein DB346_17750 [Verrucomicrobia bacterium LW23]